MTLDSTQDRSISNRAVRTQENEVVGEIGGRDTEIGLCFCGPYVLQVLAGGSYDGESWLETCVEACGADEDVDGVFVAVVADAAAFADGVYFSVDYFYVLFAEGFEIADSGC